MFRSFFSERNDASPKEVASSLEKKSWLMPRYPSDAVIKTIQSMRQHLNAKLIGVLNTFPLAAQRLKVQSSQSHCLPVKLLVGYKELLPVFALQPKSPNKPCYILLYVEGKDGMDLAVDEASGWNPIPPFSFLKRDDDLADLANVFASLVQYFIAGMGYDNESILRKDWMKGIIMALAWVDASKKFREHHTLFQANRIAALASPLNREYRSEIPANITALRQTQSSSAGVSKFQQSFLARSLTANGISEKKLEDLKTFVGSKWFAHDTAPILAQQQLFPKALPDIIKIGTMTYPMVTHPIFGFLFPNSKLDGEPQIQFHELTQAGQHSQMLAFNQYKRIDCILPFSHVWTEKQLCALVKYFYLEAHARGAIVDPQIPLSHDFRHQLRQAMLKIWDATHDTVPEEARKRDVSEIGWDSTSRENHSEEEHVKQAKGCKVKRCRWEKSYNDSEFTYDSRIPPTELLNSVTGSLSRSLSRKLREDKIKKLDNVQLDTFFDEDTPVDDNDMDWLKDWEPSVDAEARTLPPTVKKVHKKAVHLQKLKRQTLERRESIRQDVKAMSREDVERTVMKLAWEGLE
ncbi:hypothetical protein BDV96DRAFT_655510 [Lophiotrema nucula]|uniref:Uncharacterized protein n=1 Tax=Lophiotrema nucula TaxID=690887 RepID=A0A6A5YEM5_9PLEO|nr:hypothetical protein BDV96DRAFT_655510 [Lophiotrema nucula]